MYSPQAVVRKTHHHHQFISMALQVQGLSLNTGREIPAIGFGTGTSFFGRGDDVAALVGHAFQVGAYWACAFSFNTY